MSPHTVRVLSISGAAASLALTAAAVALAVLNGDAGASGDTDSSTAIGFALVLGIAFPAVGVLIAARRPENRIGWLFCSIAVVFATLNFASLYADRALRAEPGSLPAGDWMEWVGNWGYAPSFGLLGVFLLLLFPDGRLPSRRWLPVACIAAAGIAASALASALKPGPLYASSVANPAGIEGAGDVLEVAQGIGFGILVLSILAAASSLLLRLRRARGVERQQIKWLVAAAVFLGVTFPFIDAGTGPWLLALGALGITGIPIATGIAILRYRLYEIDIIIRRTLVYGVLSAGLGGTYFAIVLALQQAFSPLTEGSDLAVAGSTLAVAALFRPARRRVQALVDRRFYRRKVDAARTLDAFTARLRREIELDTLAVELRGVVFETMQPAHVSLWLRGPEGSA